MRDAPDIMRKKLRARMGVKNKLKILKKKKNSCVYLANTRKGDAEKVEKNVGWIEGFRVRRENK